MSDDSNNNPAPNPWEQEVKNLKGEFNRKNKESSDIIQQLIQSQAQLQQSIAALAPKKPAPTESNMETMLYENPGKYSQLIKEQAKQEALDEMRRETSATSSVNAVIAQLASDYPELADQESELTKNSVEILKSIGESGRSDPRSYEYAVLKAAGGLDIKPRGKRTQSEDDYVAPSYSSPTARTRKRSDESVVSANKDLAAQFGLDLSDAATKAKYIELTKRNK